MFHYKQNTTGIEYNAQITEDSILGKQTNYYSVGIILNIKHVFKTSNTQISFIYRNLW